VGKLLLSATVNRSLITSTAVSHYDRWMSGLCRVTEVILLDPLWFTFLWKTLLWF